MRMFLRPSAVGRDPLAVAMSGVRMGERLLQIGVDDPGVAGALASKPGLSGESVILVADDNVAVRARRATNATGAAATIRVHPIDRLPFEDATFDVVVIHNREGVLTKADVRSPATLRECRRLLRSGGRVVVLDAGTPSGLKGLFRSRQTPSPVVETATAAILEGAGFRAVRLLGDRESYRFYEGMNP
jgi:ubiquinone/menaquinone biosynthesis C-methylase UbiE